MAIGGTLDRVARYLIDVHRRIAAWSTLVAAGALAGCGASLAGSTQSATHLSEQQTPSLPPAPVATKPPVGYVPSFPPCAPIALPTAGIDNSSVQVGPGSWDAFVASNQWTGPVGSSANESYVVWAGATGDAANPPGVPAVAVDVVSIGADRCSTQTTKYEVFTYRPAAGPLHVTSVKGDIVYLSAPSTPHLSFSLVTHRFTTTPPAA